MYFRYSVVQHFENECLLWKSSILTTKNDLLPFTNLLICPNFGQGLMIFLFLVYIKMVCGGGGGGWGLGGGGESRNFLENAWQSWPEKGEQRHIFNSLQWGLSSLSLETPLYWDRVCQTMCKTQTPLELWLAFWVSFSRWLFSYYCPYLFWIPWDSTSHNSTRYIPVE